MHWKNPCHLWKRTVRGQRDSMVGVLHHQVEVVMVHCLTAQQHLRSYRVSGDDENCTEETHHSETRRYSTGHRHDHHLDITLHVA